MAWQLNQDAEESAEFTTSLSAIKTNNTISVSALLVPTDVSSNKNELGRRAAQYVAKHIRYKGKTLSTTNQGLTIQPFVRTIVAENGSARIIVATGASQFEFLESLVQEKEMPWDKATFMPPSFTRLC